MSSIVFVRHAQASLFKSDYDQLSELGRQQALLLGQYLAQVGLDFDAIYTGPRRRHRQTAELAVPQADGLAPPLIEIAELDEHQVDRLTTQHVEKISAQLPGVQKLEQAFRSAENQHERQKAFGRLFEAVARMWIENDRPLYGVESWPKFMSRVNDAVDQMRSRTERAQNILVFTSAGVIVAALHRALRCPDEIALGLGWRIWNCSLTEFVFSGDRFSLDQFNTMPHLNDRTHWTYR